MTQEAPTAVASPAVTDPRALDQQQSTERFLAVVAEVIGVDQVPRDEHFLDVGGDSLSMAIIVDWIGQEFGVEPEVDWFFESQDLGELVTTWWQKLQAG
jgi:acyl carrier protein